MGNHTETLQIDYDPSRITFREILEIFWSEHDPFAAASYTQYKAILFYHDEEQLKIARETRDALSAGKGRPVRTEVRPYAGFTRAEDYHQKYYLRSSGRVYGELKRRYRDDREFVDSTAAARINGYLGGFGTRKELEAEIGEFDLSGEARDALLREIRR